jgi:hypothetical protein
VCYCDDCQAAVRQLEALGARDDFHDAWNGTGYATWRDDWLTCIKGQSLLQGFKLRDNAPTTRYVAMCCKSAMFLKYGRGWWTSVYRARFGDAAPPVELRSKVERVANPGALPKDLPQLRGFPVRLFGRLLRAKLEMWLHPAERISSPSQPDSDVREH